MVRAVFAAAAALLAAIPCGGAAFLTDDPDVDAVREALLVQLCWPGNSTALPSLAAQAAMWARTLLPNKTWADINYNDYSDRAVWKTAAHIERVQNMAVAVSAPGSPALNDKNITLQLRNALSYWLQADPQNSNWWWNIIDLPQQMASIYLMLGVTPEANASGFPSPWDLERGYEIMYRAAWWNASLGYEVTGANLAWMVQAQLVRGVLPFNVNVSALDQGFARLWQEVKQVNRSMDYALAQGVQQDWSFSFHGPQIQIASYGQDYLGEQLLMRTVAAGTRWAMPQAATDLLCSYVARGMAWLSVGNAFDYTTNGRQNSRPGQSAEFGITLGTDRLRALGRDCTDVANDGAGVLAFADRVDLKPPAPDTSPALLGARYFWTNTFATAHRPGWAAMLRSKGNRTLQAECGNGESLYGRYLSEGVLNVYVTNWDGGSGAPNDALLSPYAQMFPLLNWTLISGVLSRSSVPIYDNCTKPCCWEEEVSHPAFVGGVSDGTVAAAAVDTAIGPLVAHRATFLLDSAVVTLFSNASDPSGAVASTTLATRFLRQAGGVTVATAGSANPALLPDGNYSAIEGALWAHADGIGYVFPQALPNGGPTNGAPAVAALSSGERYGNWSVIGANSGLFSGRMMTLSMSHGAGLEGGAWAYAVLPNVSAEAMPAAVAAAQASLVIVNGALVQGVADTAAHVAQAVFWPIAPNSSEGGGRVTFAGAAPGGFELIMSASGPGIVSYREQQVAGGATAAFVAVASPVLPAPGVPFTVTLSRTLTAFPAGSPLPAPQPQTGAPFPAPLACVAAPGTLPGTTVLSFVLPGAAEVNTTQGVSVLQACQLSA